MPLSLFGYIPKSRFEDCIGTESKHDHTFGGHPSDFGLSSINAPLPLHLIYRIDLRDPLVPFSLPNTNFLPLLYGLNYGTDCCYKIRSDTEFELVHPGVQEYYFPPWEAPESFPRKSTSFSQEVFDPTNADDVMDWKGVFGCDQLNSKERERALDMARERSWLSVNDAPSDDWTYEQVIDSSFDPPFAQSRPYNLCKTPDCKKSELSVIALQDNAVPDELLWPDEYVKTIWQICSTCQCITVSNQCT